MAFENTDFVGMPQNDLESARYSLHLEASLSKDIAEIKEELKGLKEALVKGLEEIRGMVKK